jgi:hypothetical protein
MWEDHETGLCRQHVLLQCLPRGASDLGDVIRERGGIPVLIGTDAVMELSAQDIAQNWTFANALPPKRVTDLTQRLGRELDQASELDGECPTNLCEEAAAFLFLALRHSRGDLDRALQGCQITWNGGASLEKVEYLT